jgi:arginyl-tRNA synthetase
VIPGDIAKALGVRASGTWRPEPPGSGAAPGTYATSLPFLMAGAAPEKIAARLADALRGKDWIDAVSVTGGGYLTVTVTDRALAALAVRVPAAGPAWAASDALRGTELTAPAAADPASAASWDEAWQLVTAWVTGRLAEMAGATVKKQDHFERVPPTGQAAPAAAVAFAGADAIRYALASMTRGRAGRIDASRWARRDLGNPFFAVRYAHARAASVLRWATDLGVDRGPADVFRPELLSHRAELELLDVISWLPERAASAARRRRPDAFARYLECLAARWLDCAESKPAVPFGGRSAPHDEHEAAARLWLAAAAQTALGSGMRLLGVAAPQRL